MKEVVVYTSSTCPYCSMAKDYLKKLNVEFTEKNVSTDRAAREELMKLGHTGVPLLIIDGQEIVGFDKCKVDELLKGESDC
ncbi:MAG: glutaredoxin family protein [Tissierellia bacterium]|nr:glutaredoxin family protein [Tissierellia bacterium]